jgi:hypothetical protein
MALIETIGAAVTGQAIGRLRERVRPNPYAPRLSDQQRAAALQAGALRPGTTGFTGSEADWFDDQGSATVGRLAIAQDLPSYVIPPSRLTPGDPGADPDDPTVLADFRDAPTRVGNPAWGVNNGTVPHVIRTRINEPTAKAPLPRDVVAGRLADQPQTVDAWDQLYEG